MSAPRHLALAELEAGLAEIRQSPAEVGMLEMIVRRPRTGEREILAAGVLDPRQGLVGDRWSAASAPELVRQLTVMNSRTIALLAQSAEFWPLAGDQLYVDFDLSVDNVPPGTRLAVGAAVIEVSDVPHTGCKKFRARYGLDAVRFVGSPIGKQLQLRGINARVLEAGEVWVGDPVTKL